MGCADRHMFIIQLSISRPVPFDPLTDLQTDIQSIQATAPPHPTYTLRYNITPR